MSRNEFIAQAVLNITRGYFDRVTKQNLIGNAIGLTNEIEKEGCAP